MSGLSLVGDKHCEKCRFLQDPGLTVGLILPGVDPDHKCAIYGKLTPDKACMLRDFKAPKKAK